MDKVKIQNKTTHNVGIQYSNGISKNLTPNMVLEIPFAEFEYLATGTRLFTEKHLVVLSDGVISEIGLNEEELRYESDEEVITKLTKSKLTDFIAYLHSVKEQHMRFKIIDIIKKNGLMNKLSASKINKLNTIFNVDLNEDFEEKETE